ncbi:MAG: fumarylacetoacetate hydrolase family protein [Proteobacteria bacterium]|nr:fumarylacetoacetate hydrolase family protein [Pseudomonadota bacterium]
MDDATRIREAAQFLWTARQRRERYVNVPDHLRPRSLAEAYAAQAAYHALAEPVYGPIAGAKIATTTKVMQQLMGIDHPCGGAVFAKTIHPSPATLRQADFVNLRIECEIALRLGEDLPAAAAPWRRDSVLPAVDAAMPAFELIEDRHADYRQTDARSLIADNCWNGGIVVGAPVARGRLPELVGIAGRMTMNGKQAAEGRAEDPYATLAWLANLEAERGRGLKRGMAVITGSVIATLSIAPGDIADFAVDGLGEAVLKVI